MLSCLLHAVDCGPPGAPQHGSLETYTDTTEGLEVFYSYDQRLVPEGRTRAVCTRNGWNPNPADLNCTESVLLHLFLLAFLLNSHTTHKLGNEVIRSRECMAHVDFRSCQYTNKTCVSINTF